MDVSDHLRINADTIVIFPMEVSCRVSRSPPKRHGTRSGTREHDLLDRMPNFCGVFDTGLMVQ